MFLLCQDGVKHIEYGYNGGIGVVRVNRKIFVSYHPVKVCHRTLTAPVLKPVNSLHVAGNHKVGCSRHGLGSYITQA